MLDILAELLIELFQGKDPKKAGQQGRQGQPGPQRAPAPPPQQPKKSTGHLFDDWPDEPEEKWPEPSADDPYVKDHPSDVAAGGVMTIEELMRRMHEKAQQGGADAPVLVPGFDTPPPGMRRAEAPPPPPRPTPKPKPQPQARPKREQPKPTPQTYAPGPSAAQQVGAPQPQPSAAKTAPGLDFVAKLRNDPAAAREAFVYAEIFGRPLGERM